MSLNGALPGGHMLTASYTLASKKNINDDFSPALTAYPNDPANLQGDYGRSRADERHHVVASAIFHVPYRITVAPVVEYGSGQPYTWRLGYDKNGDGRNSDRPNGIGRNSEDQVVTPDGSTTNLNFFQASFRVTKSFALPRSNSVDVIFEVFNLFNRTNYSAVSVDGAQYLSGPTASNPGAALIPNPRFRQPTGTLQSQEAQIGIRWTF